MKNQIEIVKEIAEGMYGIGGIPNNEEFYAEFDTRVKAELGIADVVARSEQLKLFRCPNCKQPWNTRLTDSCQCGASF